MLTAVLAHAQSTLQLLYALLGRATSYAYVRPYVTPYYQVESVQCVGPAAEHLRGRRACVVLIIFDRVSTRKIGVYILSIRESHPQG